MPHPIALSIATCSGAQFKEAEVPQAVQAPPLHAPPRLARREKKRYTELKAVHDENKRHLGTALKDQRFMAMKVCVAHGAQCAHRLALRQHQHRDACCPQPPLPKLTARC